MVVSHDLPVFFGFYIPSAYNDALEVGLTCCRSWCWG